MASFLTSFLKTTISSAVKQASSGQDYVFSGQSYNDSFEYVGVAVAHGKVLNALYPTTILKQMNFPVDLQDPEYFEKIMAKTNVLASNGVGSTLCICKIFEDRFEFSWVGDSTGKLYCENECIWQTKDHDRNNEEEQARLENIHTNCEFIATKDPSGKPILDIEVVNPTTIEMVPAKLYHFNKHNKINFTHSLGHGGVTGSHISKETVPREPGVSYKVVCATDGLWGIVCAEDNAFIGDVKNSAQAIVDFADKRWRQPWRQQYNGRIIGDNNRFPESNIDDIGVSIWFC